VSLFVQEEDIDCKDIGVGEMSDYSSWFWINFSFHARLYIIAATLLPRHKSLCGISSGQDSRKVRKAVSFLRKWRSCACWSRKRLLKV